MFRTYILSVLVSVWGRICSPNDLAHVFSPCAHNHTRSAFFYWTEACSNGTLPMPIWDLNCNEPCSVGNFLDVDPTLRQSVCVPCPKNTYSINGERFPSAGRDWKYAETRFSSYCWTTNWSNWTEGHLCVPWTPDDSGTFIASGNSNDTGWFQSDLVYYANFLEAGSVSLRYNKTSKDLDGFPNGVFEVFINGKLMHTDNSLQRNIWNNAVFRLEKGPNDVIFSFRKYNQPSHQESQVQIFDMEIRGTQTSALSCAPCLQGRNEGGTDLCEPCPANTYLEKTGVESKCVPCEVTHYSPAGSIGVQSCILRKPCTRSDYFSRFGDCNNNNNRIIEYLWTQPMTCNADLGTKLPKTQVDVPCDLCNPGYYHSPVSGNILETKCKVCPDGTALTENQIEFGCTTCPAGTSAPKAITISHWSSHPESFQTRCEPIDSKACDENQGWNFSQSYLQSSPRSNATCTLRLQRTVNITKTNGFVEFQFSLEKSRNSASEFWFEIDGFPYMRYMDDLSNFTIVRISLNQGVKELQWVHFQAGFDSSSFRLSSIIISGSEEGGAGRCIVCPPNHYSVSGSSICFPCPAGWIHSVNHTSCVLCPANTYRDYTSSDCVECPENTVASSGHISCIGRDVLIWNDTRHNITALMGRNGTGICESNQRVKWFCIGNFYGPISGAEDRSFYLSVLNPGNITYAIYNESTLAYVWGVFNEDSAVQSPGTQVRTCAKDSYKRLLNLGSRVDSIKNTSTGFLVAYGNGAICPGVSNARYHTTVEFRCDKDEGDGWPLFLREEECQFSFLWKTRFACKQCPPNRVTEVKTKCEDGIRWIRLYEDQDCVSSSSSSVLLFPEPCSQAEDVVYWPIVLGAIGLLALLIVAGVLLCKLMNVKKRYMRLLEVSDPRGEKEQ